MLRKMNLFSALFAMTVILAAVGTTQAFAVFTVGGVKMICQTCMCGEMASAGVPLDHCVDFMVVSNGPKPYSKIIRYSENDVRLLSADGTQSPLSSDASQKQFDEIARHRNFKQLLGRLRPTAGVISAPRVERLAKDLGVEVVSSDDLDGTDVAGQGGVTTVLATIRDGRLLGLRTIKPTERISLSGDVYKAQARGRGGKLVLQFDRPLGRESKGELKIDVPLNLDRQTGTSLETCGCLPGVFTIDNVARTSVVTIDTTPMRRGHRWSTRYIVDACPHW
jgi:hypothetical protein